ncbi:MAG: M56 family metallopeptidase [Acidimicrobiia bacterium]
MTAALVVLAGLVLVAIPGICGPRFRLAGAEWARLAAASLAAGIAAIELGLVMLALPTVLRALHAAGFAAICERVLAPLAPGGDLLGWVAVGLASVVTIRAFRAGRCAQRDAHAARVEPWLGVHEQRGEYELVVLPTEQLLAVSVPATPPQILVSDGLVSRLEAEELEAVIRHEAAHHRFRHWRYSLLAVTLERALRPLPLVGRSTQALRTALEAWADEGAAGSLPHGRALVRRAIVTVAGMPGAPGALERARRLAHPTSARPLSLRVVAHGPVLFLAVGLLVLLSSWAVGVHHAVALAGYCPD